MIYLDHNATTPMVPAVVEAMLPYFTAIPGNPASSHRFGRKARQALEDAREQIAALLGARADEVVFTSGATEANNLALFGLAGEPPGPLVSSPIEHPCVIEPLKKLAERGFAWTRLSVDREGRVMWNPDAIPDSTRLVSVMLANHETGTIQPVEAIVATLAGRVPVHTDAAAAVGKIPVHFHQLGVGALTVSAHKLFGPKGIGALLVNRCTKLQPLLWGGHQQQGRRPGTEPVPLVVGFAKALELAIAEMDERRARSLRLRQVFLDELRRDASPMVVNGPETGGLPATLNLSFPGCRADALLMALDLAGVACSTGSACSSGSLLPSPILQAMQVPQAVWLSAMRFSWSPFQSEAEVVEAAGRISRVVQRLRREESE